MSGLTSSALDFSSRNSEGRDNTLKCLLRFSEEFLDPSSEIKEWYNLQPYKRFRTIQYWKEKTGVMHEFIIILLLGEEGNDIRSQCRVERTGDLQHKFQTIRIDGTIARDYIQAIPLDHPGAAGLTCNSGIVAEITFPLTFDLLDVLAICYGISKHRKAKRYTLQRYNCYFFSWTLILALARACVRWDIDGQDLSLQGCVKKIQENLSNSVNEQGSRLHSIAYIVSNNIPIGSENLGGHPLDRVFGSMLRSEELSFSLVGVLRDVLWVENLRARLTTGLKEYLGRLASKSLDLLSFEEPQKTTDSQHKHDLNLERTCYKLVEKAMVVGCRRTRQRFGKALSSQAQDIALVKQRLGRKVWCTYHGKTLFGEVSGRAQNVISSPPGYLLTPILAVVSLGYCLVGAGRFSVGLSCEQEALRCKARHDKNGGGLRRTVVCSSRIVGHTLIGLPGSFSILWNAQDMAILERVGKDLGPELTGFIEVARDQEVGRLMKESWGAALELVTKGLRESIGKDQESDPKVLRPYFLSIMKHLAAISLFSPGLNAVWEWILWNQFLDGMVEVVYSDFTGWVAQGSDETMLRVIAKHGYSAPSMLSASGTENCGKAAAVSGTEPSRFNPHTIDGLGILNVETPGAESWSYRQLQDFVREQVCRLSKQEIEFASYLKHLPLTNPEYCQKQIEDSIEEIWRISWPLMQTWPQE